LLDSLPDPVRNTDTGFATKRRHEPPFPGLDASEQRSISIQPMLRMFSLLLRIYSEHVFGGRGV
jgi:hypothetical protein